MSDTQDGFVDFSIGSGDEFVGKKTKRFKGKEGETYRVSFVWHGKDKEGNTTTRFTGCERHYMQGVGYFLHKGPEYSRIAGGPPKQAVATIIVVWPTDKHGRLDKEAFARGEGYEVKPWVFSADRYNQLARRNVEFPLHEYDLTMACTDTQYQKMDLSPCRESLYVQLLNADKDMAKRIVENIQREVQEIEKTIRSDMARDLSIEQIREKLGGSTATPTSGGAAENVDDLLDNLID